MIANHAIWSCARKAAVATATISTVGPMRKVIWCASFDSSSGVRSAGDARGLSSSPSTPVAQRKEVALPWHFWSPFWRGLALPAAGMAVLVTQLDYLITNVFSAQSRLVAGLGLLASLLDSCKDIFVDASAIPCKTVTHEDGTCQIGNGSHASNLNVNWVCASMRGWRPTMEDTHIATSISRNGNELGMFAVFDGHGGQEVSALVQLLLPHVLEKRLTSMSSKADVDLANILTDAVEEVDVCLFNGPLGIGWLLSSLHPFWSVGCTSCVAVVDPIERKIVVANTGDSRAILCRDGVAISLSEDHKPEDSEEYRRIRKAGGTVVRYGPCFRVDGGLNLSRALGDFKYKTNVSLPSHEQKIVARPDITTQEWLPGSADEFLVIACDGLFERMNRQQVVNHIRGGLANGAAPREVLQDLLHACCARTSRDAGQDNETIILVQW